MERLNDYCLLEIFRYLTLREEMNMYLQCVRLSHLLIRKWRTEYQAIDERQFVTKFGNLSITQYRILLIAIRETVQKIEMNFCNKLFHINTLRFPSVHTLTFTAKYGPEYINCRLLYKMFPNLLNFSPRGNFRGDHCTVWRQLRHLSLEHCDNFEISYLPQILRNLHLTSLTLCIFRNEYKIEEALGVGLESFCRLQVLTINNMELPMIFSIGIQNMRCLKEFIVTNLKRGIKMYELYSKIAFHKGADIEKMWLINDEFRWNTCTNLNELQLCYKFELVMSLLEHCNHVLLKLRELHLYQCEFETQSQVQILLKSALQLDFIYIDLVRSHFRSLRLHVNSIAERRTKLLSAHIKHGKAFQLLIIGSSPLFDAHVEKIDQIEVFLITKFCFRNDLREPTSKSGKETSDAAVIMPVPTNRPAICIADRSAPAHTNNNDNDNDADEITSILNLISLKKPDNQSN